MPVVFGDCIAESRLINVDHEHFPYPLILKYTPTMIQFIYSDFSANFFYKIITKKREIKKKNTNTIINKFSSRNLSKYTKQKSLKYKH